MLNTLFEKGILNAKMRRRNGKAKRSAPARIRFASLSLCAFALKCAGFSNNP